MGLILVIVPILITYFRIRQLNHQRARLEEMVAERTIEIQNKNELLKELNSTKDKLFSIISHDLRSPFSAILGFQDLLVSNYSGYTDEERIEMLRQVQSTTNQVYYLVENLLSWSRIQTNSIKPIPVLFNLKEILPDKIDLYQDIAKVKGITLESKIPDNLEGYADINIMTGVLRNLINNSIKFTPNGGKITISAEQENNHVLISVNDTGTGMSTTQINELFSIETTKSKQGTNGEPGSGLGLILCKEFTEKNKGQLRIESEEGKGSTFSFTIPLKP
jgi:signal transduction histidine kinase